MLAPDLDATAFFDVNDKIDRLEVSDRSADKFMFSMQSSQKDSLFMVLG